MGDVGVDRIARHGQPDRERLEQGGEARAVRPAPHALPRRVRARADARGRRRRLVEAADLDGHPPPERLRQLAAHDAGAAVDVRWVLAGEEKCLHNGSKASTRARPRRPRPDAMVPIIYTVFPTLVGPPDRWPAHAKRPRQLGFNWLYVNPYQYPGFSGSLYATKLYDRLHPALEPSGPGSGMDALARAFAESRALGVGVMVDLVVNHTSKDSPLVTEHPNWFRRDGAAGLASPSVADPADTRRVVVWGDLAEVDNASSPDREALWRFWEGLVDRALDLGVTGFRADAAYKVPAALWQRLIARARAREPHAMFVAETLGCTLEQMAALGGVGFDYFYNSSKWWDFTAPWCLEQHERFRRVASSISFAESHDTPRLAAETGGAEAVQRQRYAFAALFSAGVQMPIGYEWGFRRALDVVKTRPADWESPRFDIARFVERVNRLKAGHPLLGGEGVLRPLDWRAPEVTAIRRWSDEAGTHRGAIVVNRDRSAPHEVAVDRGELPGDARLLRPALDGWPAEGIPVPDRLRLEPAEVVLLARAP